MTVQKIQALKSHLRTMGYYHINLLEKKDDSFQIIAEGVLRSILLFVTIEHHMSSSMRKEIQQVKSKARDLQKEPWAAIIKSDDGKKMDEIAWFDLSKRESLKILFT